MPDFIGNGKEQSVASCQQTPNSSTNPMLMLIWIEFIKRENKHKNKNIRTEELSCKNRI